MHGCTLVWLVMDFILLISFVGHWCQHCWCHWHQCWCLCTLLATGLNIETSYLVHMCTCMFLISAHQIFSDSDLQFF